MRRTGAHQQEAVEDGERDEHEARFENRTVFRAKEHRSIHARGVDRRRDERDLDERVTRNGGGRPGRGERG